MWKPQFAADGTKSGIGLGFFVEDRNGRRRIGHNGAIYGFATELAYLPDEKLGVVVAISCDCANPIATHIASFALDSMIAVKKGTPLPESIPATPLPEGLAKTLVGRWESEDGKVKFD